MASSLAGQSILVTGGAGFLGSHVVNELRARGAERVWVPRSRECDLTDAGQTRALFERTKPDLVMHLAARVGGIGANKAHPGLFFHDNMAMGLHVLEQARLSGTQKVVIAGTICSYPKVTPVPFREDNLWNGYPEEITAPYGIAKKALLVMAQTYRQEFGCNYVMLLPVNLYGPGDNFDLETGHVMPALIRRFIEATERGAASVTLWGDGSPTREFIYAADAARGLVDAAEHYNDGDPVNLGTGHEISIRELATRIAEATGFRGRIDWDTSRPNGQPRRGLDVSRARERFGFNATVPLEQGLAQTIAWYREHRKSIEAADATRKGT